MSVSRQGRRAVSPSTSGPAGSTIRWAGVIGPRPGQVAPRALLEPAGERRDVELAIERAEPPLGLAPAAERPPPAVAELGREVGERLAPVSVRRATRSSVAQ